jgi:hypothetical protein
MAAANQGGARIAARLRHGFKEKRMSMKTRIKHRDGNPGAPQSDSPARATKAGDGNAAPALRTPEQQDRGTPASGDAGGIKRKLSVPQEQQANKRRRGGDALTKKPVLVKTDRVNAHLRENVGASPRSQTPRRGGDAPDTPADLTAGAIASPRHRSASHQPAAVPSARWRSGSFSSPLQPAIAASSRLGRARSESIASREDEQQSADTLAQPGGPEAALPGAAPPYAEIEQYAAQWTAEAAALELPSVPMKDLGLSLQDLPTLLGNIAAGAGYGDPAAILPDMRDLSQLLKGVRRQDGASAAQEIALAALLDRIEPACADWLQSLERIECGDAQASTASTSNASTSAPLLAPEALRQSEQIAAEVDAWLLPATDSDEE